MIAEILTYSSIISFIVGIATAVAFFYARSRYRQNNIKKRNTAKEYQHFITQLTTVFSEGHQLNRTSQSHNGTDRLLDFLQKIVDEYKILLDTITESDCSVIIKVFVPEGKETFVMTLVRTSSANQNNSPNYFPYKHQLMDDTSALAAFSGSKYFLENDIAKMTSQSYVPNTNFQNSIKSQMPYQSLLVVPIKPLSNNNSEPILGVLCVESKKKNVFDKSVDIDIAMGLADAIVPFLKQFDNFQNLSNKRI